MNSNLNSSSSNAFSSDDLSIVIRVKNESEFIGSAIQSCLDFIEFPQIIVVDNNSTDESVLVARLFAQDSKIPVATERFTDVQIVSISDYSPGKSLNLGIQKANRKYIMILSSHCNITAFDFDSLTSKLEQYSAVFGKQIPYYRGKRIKPNYLWSHFVNVPVENMYSSLEDRYFFHNAFSFSTRKFLIDHPFDEELVSKEDRYWVNDLISRGSSFYYDPKHVSSHHYTPNGNTWKGIG